MTATDRFLASTRGRILTYMLRSPATVAELADAFDISANAARQHLTALERDGYVERFRIKPTASKPAAVYRPTRAGQDLFPKAYGPVLGALAEQYVDDHGGQEEKGDFLLRVGHRLGQTYAPPEEASTEERIDYAIELLTDLGSVLEVNRFSDGVVRLDGYGCPLSAVVRHHPEFCRMIAVMLEDIIVLPVKPCCDNEGDSPNCRLLVGQPDTAA